MSQGRQWFRPERILAAVAGNAGRAVRRAAEPFTRVPSCLRQDKQNESEEDPRTRITYEIVEHDGGWAYRVGDVFSETFPTHDQAREAAEIAAAEQTSAGADETIEYEDEKGVWHEENASGGDRPETDVEG